MKSLFRFIKRKKNARRLLAASFLLVAIMDLGTHAFAGSYSGPAVAATTWCAKYHYANSGIDCPHKHDHRTPEKSAFDEISHNAVLLNPSELAITGALYRVQPPVPLDNTHVSRSLEPPVRPPKQA